jgi:hypothetical protein
MSPKAAFHAGTEHVANDRKLSDARAFWLSSMAIRNLISEGRIEEAVPIFREMWKSAKLLSNETLLGRRMLATSESLFDLMLKTDRQMAEAGR